MKRLSGAFAVLALLVGTAHGMGSRPSVGTGDKEFDSTLVELGAKANQDPDRFIRELGSKSDIPEGKIRRAIDAFHLGGPDIYMATVLAHATRRPVLRIAETYREKPGKGWGRVAKDLGMKPGSPEFHDLKDGASRFLKDLSATATSKREHAESVRYEEAQSRNMKGHAKGKGNGKP